MRGAHIKLAALLVLIIASGGFLIYLLTTKTTENKLSKELQKWINQKLTIEKGIEVFDRDSISDKSYRILIYVDDQGCTTCKLRLSEWHQFRQLLEALAPGKIAYQLLFDGKQIDEIRFLLKTHAWDNPLYWDREGKMNKKYNFPKNEAFRCFLLDKDERVLLVGNPVYSEAIRELYIQYFAEQLQK